MADDLAVTEKVTIPGDELDETFSASGGPGGQHANRSNTRVELRWKLAESRLDDEVTSRLRQRLETDVVVVVAADSRSQFRNRQLARRRLKELVADALRPEPPARRRTRPSRAARQRRLDEKARRSEVKRQRRKPDPE